MAEHHAIKMTQGKVFLRWDGKRRFRKNRKTYWLDLATGHWLCGREKDSQHKQLRKCSARRTTTNAENNELGVVLYWLFSAFVVVPP